MPIEGPLHELGLPDVFQLLDLSRKTGVLRVTSRTLNDEGIVYFQGGRVVQTHLRSQPQPPVEAAAYTPRELDRKLRTQAERAVYELMSWREGFFSFEERPLDELPAEGRVSIATESLLMESARRIDEWSRIVDKIPHLGVVLALADQPEDHESQLDLLPHEWEVLSLIDGRRDLRGIAAALGRGEFEAAKVAYGLLTTGVVDVVKPGPAPAPVVAEAHPDAESEAALERGFAAVRAGNFATARENLERFLVLAPDHPDADRARGALNALAKLLGAMGGVAS